MFVTILGSPEYGMGACPVAARQQLGYQPPLPREVK